MLYGLSYYLGSCFLSDEHKLIEQMIDDLKEREAKLEATNRKMNQRVLELEHGMGQSVPRIPGSREELELKLAEANKKTVSLQDTLAKKDIEMQGMEERYKKYIEKAKSVIKTLDPKQNPNAAPEMSALRNQLGEKDRLIETLEQVRKLYLADNCLAFVVATLCHLGIHPPKILWKLYKQADY